jgi:hypothetical protein
MRLGAGRSGATLAAERWRWLMAVAEASGRPVIGPRRRDPWRAM